jgi:hypothetical protein
MMEALGMGPGPVSRPSATVEEALARLGLPLESGFAALDPLQGAAVATLVDGIREASVLLNQAFQHMDAGERNLLLRHAMPVSLVGPRSQDLQDEDAEAARLLSLVNGTALRSAGLILTQAAESAQAMLTSLPPGPTLPESSMENPWDALLVAPTGAQAIDPLPPSLPNPCLAIGGSIVDPNGLIEVGLAGSNHYTMERVLIVDLGGDDCYENHAASYGPGTALPIPISVVLDVSGNDQYLAYTPVAGSFNTWSSGVGLGGVGLLVDGAGDDVHRVQANPACLDGAQPWTAGQGIGVLGIGALIDAGGNDLYSVSFSATGTVGCHFHPMIAGQAFADVLGAGLLMDATGNDRYEVNSNSQSAYASVALASGQAVAGIGGLAALVDGSGNDRYETTQSMTSIQGSYNKGIFGRVLAQGTAFEGAGVLPATGVNPCSVVTLGACNPSLDIATALLADLGGSDRYNAAALADGGTWGGCHSSAAVAYAQGAIADQGYHAMVSIGGLVDLASLGPDQFILEADAKGNCPEGSVTGQGGALSQGIGAGLSVPNPSDPITVPGTHAPNPSLRPALGLLVRADCFIPERPDFQSWQVDPTIDPVFLVLDRLVPQNLGIACPCPVQPPSVDPAGSTAPIATTVKGILTCLPDCDPAAKIQFGSTPCHGAPATGATYTARATAASTASLAWTTPARTTVQGAADSVRAPDPALLGVHIDISGADRFIAEASASSPGATNAFVVAQGASARAVGVLANIGGNDTYQALAFVNGVPVPLPTPAVLAQGDASRDGIGLMIDVLGTDGYTQPCPGNAVPLELWGNLPTYTCGSTVGYILGLDLGS